MNYFFSLTSRKTLIFAFSPQFNEVQIGEGTWTILFGRTGFGIDLESELADWHGRAGRGKGFTWITSSCSFLCVSLRIELLVALIAQISSPQLNLPVVQQDVFAALLADTIGHCREEPHG